MKLSEISKIVGVKHATLASRIKKGISGDALFAIVNQRAQTRHGGSSAEALVSGLSKTYTGMLDRCYNASNKKFKNWGGRGIEVCGRWRGIDGFKNFSDDMGPRPSSQHSIERKENNGNYEPGNCRWATPSEQARNTRKCKVITIGSETKTASEWSDISGLKGKTIIRRIQRGWSEDRLLIKSLHKK